MAELSKQQIRELALAERKRIGAVERALGEQEINTKFLKELAKLRIPRGNYYIALYRSEGSEVSTKDLALSLEEYGYQLVYPQVLGDGLMEFRPDTDEPTTDNPRVAGDASTGFVCPEQIALMVVPLVAFDGSGHRLGMGGGYYDRYLPRLLAQTPTVGLAFDQQLKKTLPNQPHDVALSAIITPSVIFTRKAS